MRRIVNVWLRQRSFFFLLALVVLFFWLPPICTFPSLRTFTPPHPLGSPSFLSLFLLKGFWWIFSVCFIDKDSASSSLVSHILLQTHKGKSESKTSPHIARASALGRIVVEEEVEYCVAQEETVSTNGRKKDETREEEKLPLN